MGAPSPRTTWPCFGRGRSASMSSRPQNLDLEDGVCREYDFRNFEAQPSAITVREPKKKSRLELRDVDSTPRTCGECVEVTPDVTVVSKTVTWGCASAAASRL